MTRQTQPQRLKNSEHVENDRPSSVMIPFMITNSMRAQLRELGLTEEEIYKIPTDRAHELLLQHQHVLSPNEDIWQFRAFSKVVLLKGKQNSFITVDSELLPTTSKVAHIFMCQTLGAYLNPPKIGDTFVIISLKSFSFIARCCSFVWAHSLSWCVCQCDRVRWSPVFVCKSSGTCVDECMSSSMLAYLHSVLL